MSLRIAPSALKRLRKRKNALPQIVYREKIVYRDAPQPQPQREPWRDSSDWWPKLDFCFERRSRISSKRDKAFLDSLRARRGTPTEKQLTWRNDISARLVRSEAWRQ